MPQVILLHLNPFFVTSLTWTSAAADERAADQSMDPRAATKKALHSCGGDTSSCPGPYPTTSCPVFQVG